MTPAERSYRAGSVPAVGKGREEMVAKKKRPAWEENSLGNSAGLRVGDFRLTVHRCLRLPGWFVSFAPVHSSRQLKADDLESAKREALELVTTTMENALKDLRAVER